MEEDGCAEWKTGMSLGGVQNVAEVEDGEKCQDTGLGTTSH